MNGMTFFSSAQRKNLTHANKFAHVIARYSPRSKVNDVIDAI